MQKYVDDAWMSGKFYIDSAGIGPWHVGQLPDKRIRRHGARRGYSIDHIARQFDARHDFSDFDYIVVMDDENYRDICSKAHCDAERRKVIRTTTSPDTGKGHQSPTHTTVTVRTSSSLLTSSRTDAAEYWIN